MKTIIMDGIIADLLPQLAVQSERQIDAVKQLANRVWTEAFKRGYERGKSDERDAKAIDSYLANEEVVRQSMTPPSSAVLSHSEECLRQLKDCIEYAASLEKVRDLGEELVKAQGELIKNLERKLELWRDVAKRLMSSIQCETAFGGSWDSSQDITYMHSKDWFPIKSDLLNLLGEKG